MIASAGQLAEASDCIGKAYDGVESKAGYAYSVYPDPISATAKTRRRDVRRSRSALDSYTGALHAASNYGKNLGTDASLGKALGQQVASERRTYSKRNGDTYVNCSPE